MDWTRYDLWVRSMLALSSVLIVTGVAILVAELVYGREAIPSIGMVAFSVFGTVAVCCLAALEWLFMTDRIATPPETIRRDFLIFLLSTVALAVFLIAVFP